MGDAAAAAAPLPRREQNAAPPPPSPPPPPIVNADVLCLVLSRLEPRELAATRRVSRSWRTAAAAAMPIAFKRTWRLARIVAAPAAGGAACAGGAASAAPPRRGRCALMERAALATFVRRVRVGRGDSIQSLALKHGVAPADVKQANGLISDHSLHAHSTVLVPVASAGELEGACVRLEHVAAANRDVAVLVDPADAAGASSDGDEGDDDGDAGGGSGSSGGDGADGSRAGGGGAGGSRRRRPKQSAREAQRLAQVLARSTVLRGDGGAALFYLEASGGDVKAALAAAAADEAWEDTTLGPGVRLAPVARFINGEAGL